MAVFRTWRVLDALEVVIYIAQIYVAQVQAPAQFSVLEREALEAGSYAVAPQYGVARWRDHKYIVHYQMVPWRGVQRPYA